MIKAENVHKILKKHILADGYKYVFDFDKSSGSYLYDSLGERHILDCFGQFGSLALGYNHPKILDNIGHLMNVSECKIVNSDLYSEQMASFVDTLFEKALPKEFEKAFFIEGGSAAVENALKVAFDYYAKRHRLSDEECQGNRGLDVVHLKESFHGRGGYTLSLTNTTPEKTEFFPRFPWTRVLNPKNTLPNIPEAEEQSLKQIKEAMQKRNVACVILETVQSEGGNYLFRKEYFEGIRKLCDDSGALMILDEVQTGFGASGKWWAFEHYGVTPDIVVFGKKAQVCGIAATMRNLKLVENNCFSAKSRINSTWGGNIVDMVRSKIIINTIADNDYALLKNVETVGKYLQESLMALQGNKISNVRGIGTLVAFDMPSKDERNQLIEKLSDEMIILGCGTKTIRFRPALTFSKQDVDTAMGCIKKHI